MSDCFWTDLVRVAQNCGDDPDPPEPSEFFFAAVCPDPDEQAPWFIAGNSPCGWYPGQSSGFDGSYFSARYEISQAQFDALSCGDPVVLDGLNREAINIRYEVPDNGFLPETAVVQTYDWPDHSFWIVELTPGYGPDPEDEEDQWTPKVYIAFEVVHAPWN